MANTLQLKRRIKTAQNVSKTTKAMQMIAASKMKRAQNAALAARPYVEKISTVSKDLIKKLDEGSLHPYMKKPQGTDKTLLIVLSPDKGLCGGLITNLLKEYFSLQHESTTSVITVGKKIEPHAARSKSNILASFPFGTNLPTFESVYPIIKLIDEYYLSGKVSTVKILSTSFVSIFTQKPVVSTLLPLVLTEEEIKEQHTEQFELFEPSIQAMLPTLLKRYLEMSVYQYFLESFVSEQAARMIAMQNATDNAKDIIEILTLEYNKARQTRITNEILDIAGASAALHI